ncbi:MAG: hypothetical protein ACI8PZ_003664 [Myxococcota bacterium]|jgi:hypothetical protein
MQLEITGHYGVDGVAHRLAARLDGSTPVELRALAVGAIPDALDRLEDTAAYLDAHPDPGLPTAYGVVTLDGWAALVLEATEGPTVRELCREPLPDDLAATLLFRGAQFLERLHHVRGPGSQPLDLRVGCLSTAGLRAGRPFSLRWCQPESLAGVAPASRMAWPPKPTGGPEDDVFDLGVVLLELLLGHRAAESALRDLAKITDATGHHRRLREALRGSSGPDSLLRMAERMCSFHADERPLPAEIVDVTSEYQLADALVFDAIEGRSGLRTPPGVEHPLVGLQLGPRTEKRSAAATMGPDDYLPPLRPGESPPPRPTPPLRTRARLDTGGVTVFERQVPRRSPAESSTPDAEPIAPVPAPYVPPPQLDTPDTAASSRMGWVVGGGCALAGLALAGVILLVAALVAVGLFL